MSVIINNDITYARCIPEDDQKLNKCEIKDKMTKDKLKLILRIFYFDVHHCVFSVQIIIFYKDNK